MLVLELAEVLAPVQVLEWAVELAVMLVLELVEVLAQVQVLELAVLPVPALAEVSVLERELAQVLVPALVEKLALVQVPVPAMAAMAATRSVDQSLNQSIVKKRP